MDQEEDENESFYVNMAPSCFMQRERSEKNFNRESSMEHLLTELAKELAQTLKQTKGGIGLLPNTIANVLKSQACRGVLSIINSTFFFLTVSNLSKGHLFVYPLLYTPE